MIEPKGPEQLLKEFDNDLMQWHPKDSGAGSNYPSDPHYEFNCEPKEMRDWLKSALASVVLWAAERNYMHKGGTSEWDDGFQSANQQFFDALQDLAKKIAE